MTVRPVPEGSRSVTPCLVVHDARRLLEFTKAAFAAVELECHDAPDGSVAHAQVRIGDSNVMMGEARDAWPAIPSMLYLYLSDCDGVYAKALAAGGTSLQAPRTEFYGDRVGAVKDPCGNSWYVATHVEDVAPDELARRAAQAHARGKE